MSVLLASLFAGAYLSGSIPFGVLLTRLFVGVDVRAQGSGNIGATNVARVAGKRVGVAVLVLDALKGALPVYLATRVLPGLYPWHAAVGIMAVLGHIFPIWLRFRGGKGVATALGVFAVLLPISALAAFGVYALIYGCTRTSSIGSLAGGATAVGVTFIVATPEAYRILAVGLLALMILTHRGNIARILKRTERQV